MERQSVVRGDGEIRRESPYGSSKENTYAGVVADIPALVAATLGAAERYNTGSVFVAWQASPALLFETGYNYLKSHGDSSAAYRQVTLAADYALSKRTDLYATTSYGHASGSNGAGPAQAVIADAYVDGGKAAQELAIVGIRHRF